MRLIECRHLVLVLALALACVWSGCSALTGFGDLRFEQGLDAAGPMDAGEPDAAERDLGPAEDAGGDARPPGDAAPRDSGPRDAGPRDSGPPDSGPRDSGPRDSGPDMGPPCVDDATGIRAIRMIGRELGIAGRPGVIAYRVEYDVGTLRMWGQICVPDSPGRHAAVVYNHHGFEGLAGQWGVDGGFLGLVPNICTYVARRNAVAIMPQFRGQTDSAVTSGGTIEYCLGEVEDAEALARIAMGRCDVDAERITVVGYDHGGCVALQMVHRGIVPLAAAAAVAAPVNLSELHAKWVLDPMREADRLDLERWVGGTPDTHPEAYRSRSPLGSVTALAAADVPLMIVHGALDAIVPIQQSCDLRQALASEGIGFTSFHVDATGAATTAPITQCSMDSATYVTPWPPAGAMGRFSGPDYFLGFEQGHEFDAFRGPQAVDAYLDFLLAHVGPL